MRSREYVFTTEGKRLRFVGNFDGLYSNEVDPWGQSGSDETKNLYYRLSRRRLCNVLRARDARGFGLEVGCGLGYALQVLTHELPGVEWYGLDVSSAAIERARALFPDAAFIEGNISDWRSLISFDVVVLNQCLWYLLERLDETVENCHRILNAGGLLVVSQAFLREQRYGKEICDGFAGTVATLASRFGDKFSLIEARHDDASRLEQCDGLIMLRKRNAIRSNETKSSP